LLVKQRKSSFMYRVLIDTSAFEKEGCLFSGVKFNSLKTLSAQGHIRLVLSSIVRNEVEQHIQQSMTLFANKVKVALNSGDHIARVDVGIFNDIRSNIKRLKEQMIIERLEKMTKFFKSIEFDELTYNNVNVNNLVSDYFLQNAPFSNGKKNEFPDAIILNAFIAQYHDSLDQTCIVSSDEDFSNFCANHPKINFFRSIGEFLDFINSKQNEMLFEQLHHVMSNNIEKLEGIIAGSS
jgi:hypothetical protein